MGGFDAPGARGLADVPIPRVGPAEERAALLTVCERAIAAYPADRVEQAAAARLVAATLGLIPDLS